jgi:threonine synthase
METACAAKFEEVVLSATGENPPVPKHLEYISTLPRKVEEIEPRLQTLMNYIERNAI